MPNELNKFLDTFLPYGVDIAQGLDKARLQGQASDILQKGMSRLDELFNPEPIRQTGMTGDDINPPIEQAPDFQKGLQSLFQTQSELAPYGDIGKQYSSQLESLFDTNVKLNQPPKRDIRESQGQFIDLTDPNKPQVIYGEKKQEKKKLSFGDYESMSYEDAVKLPVDEIENALFYFSPDVKEKLLQNEGLSQLRDKYLKEGDYSPRTPTGRRRSGSILPQSGEESKDITKFKSIAETLSKFENQVKTEDTENTTYSKNLDELAKEYDIPIKDIQRVAVKINQAHGDKEVSKIIRSLEKGDYHNETQHDQNFLDERRRIYEQDGGYLDQLDQAYQLEQSGQKPQGYFQEAKEKFYNELEWDKDNGILTLKEYKYYHDLYR